MNPKVLLVIGSAAIGGAEKQLVTLASKLIQDKIDCKVLFLMTGGVLEDVLKVNKVSYQIADFKNHSRITNLFSSVQLIIKHSREGYNVFYIFLPQAVLYFGRLSRFINRKLLLIYGIRGSIFVKNSITYKMYRSELKNCDLMICNSNFIENEILSLKNIEAKKIKVIKNGIETYSKKLEKRERISREYRAIVVANFRQYKGHDLLLQAIRKIKTVKLHITLVGAGMELEKTISESNTIQHHIFDFVGESTQIRNIYVNQDFAIHPSTTESLSNAVLEALNYGLPVVCFDVGGNNELIENFKNGYLVKPFNVEDFADAIELITSNDKHLIYMSNNARRKAALFNWESNLKLHIEAFDHALIEKLI